VRRRPRVADRDEQSNGQECIGDDHDDGGCALGFPGLALAKHLARRQAVDAGEGEEGKHDPKYPGDGRPTTGHLLNQTDGQSDDGQDQHEYCGRFREGLHDRVHERAPRLLIGQRGVHPSMGRPQPSGFPPWCTMVFVIEVSPEQFEELVAQALEAVPVELARLVDNVVFVIEDDGPADDPDLLGLYEGIALTERDTRYAGTLPDRITVYRNPTLRMCDSLEEVVDEVNITVVHEIAHHFGIDDDRLHELGYD